MKPAPFTWHRAGSVDEALALLAREGSSAKPLAGGQSLIPAMNFRLARPAALVDLNHVTELAGITTTPGGGLRLGAMTRHRALERSADVAARAPLLAEAMPWVAHAQIRTRGTVGGSVAHADPAAELPAVLVALGARYLAKSRAGERWIAAEEFATGLFATALRPDELLVAIEVPPAAPRTGYAFIEMARRHGDFGLAGVAAALTLGDDGRCVSARVGLLGVGDGPVSSQRAAAVLAGQAPGAEAWRAAGDAARTEVDPPSDIHASAAFRRKLVDVLTRRALARAAERAA